MSADVDLDFGNRDDVLDLIKHIPARIEGKKVTRHNSGVYIQPIPIDPTMGISSISYKEADDRGYFKLDFLNVSVYNKIKDYDHYNELLATEPPWERLKEKDFVEQLVHVGNYPDLISEMMPDNIVRMAMFISAIRPAKKHLLGKPWKEIAETIWIKPDNDEYYFKKSHSIAYSTLVALHMNLIDTLD